MPSYPSIWDIEFLNANSQRKYPLHEDSTLADVSSSVTIPNDFIVDMILPVHVDNTINPERFHIIGISVFGNGVNIAIGYDGTEIGNVSIDSATFATNSSYNIQCVDNFFDTVGKVVIGSLENIMQIAGSFSFTLAAARLSPTVVKPDIRGVSAIYLQNGADRSDPIQGDIVLQAGKNMLISFVSGAGTDLDPHRIVFNAIDGQGLNTNCDCAESQDLPCIKTINGVSPDGAGNFNLLGSTCITLEGISNGVRMLNECSQPCCGCEELKVVKQTNEQIVKQINSLEHLAARLENAITQMHFNLLDSDPWGSE